MDMRLFLVSLAVLLAGCVSTTNARQQTELNKIHELAHQDCQSQIQSTSLTYQKPINCPACSPSDHTTYLIDQLWHSVVTRKWYSGHSPSESNLDIRTHLSRLSPNSLAVIDLVAPLPNQRLDQGSEANILLRAVIDGCREVARQ